MCGIAGFLNTHSSNVEADAVVGRMADALAHRGPDDRGTWVDPAAGIALGHRRLSIVDLSASGHQPMLSASGRTVIAYNGEVYNHADLRLELEARGLRFRGTSDTEVILEACEVWGVEAVASRLIGMFAFAIWDRETRTLALARDRFGIKPVYLGEVGDTLVFGSELKALAAYPGFAGDIDRSALCAFLRHNYVPAPHTIFRGVRKMPQGSVLTIREGRAPETRQFWSMREVARAGLAARGRTLTDQDAEAQFDALLRDAVGRRMIADVPLGAFLSGGIDSSTVVALMQAQSSRPVRTFTIGFADKTHDEAVAARAVAGHLGTDHTELFVEPSHVLAAVPRMATVFDEPFADPSQIPTLLVSELTRRYVTVALSGDGGDELFAGYERYARTAAAWQRVSAIPAPARHAAAAIAAATPNTAWEAARRVISPRRVVQVQRVTAGSRGSFGDFYRHSVSHWAHPERLVIGGTEPAGIFTDPSVAALVTDPVEQMQWLDSVTYLPDDILVKLDRTSMAVSLEARVPLIDHRVAEFAWSLPAHFRVRNGRTKWLLRRVLSRYVPDALVDRPKMGFGVPLAAWLRGPLREWAEDLLGEARLSREGFLAAAPIRQAWQEHLSQRADWADQLWSVLMFQSWLAGRRSNP